MDEKNKSPCFIPKTPTSEDKSNIEQITTQDTSLLSRRRKSRTLDFRFDDLFIFFYLSETDF